LGPISPIGGCGTKGREPSPPTSACRLPRERGRLQIVGGSDGALALHDPLRFTGADVVDDVAAPWLMRSFTQAAQERSQTRSFDDPRAMSDYDRAGRVKVGVDLSVPGHPDIFVVGDTAAVTDQPGIPGTAPPAIRFPNVTI
jgi:hypothetical protein